MGQVAGPNRCFAVAKAQINADGDVLALHMRRRCLFRVVGAAPAVFGHLDIAKAPVISHSMGARITLHLLLHHSDRLSAAVLIGVGESLLLEQHDPEIMAQALLSDEPWAIEDQAAASFRAFVDSTRSDHKALAACTHGIGRELEQNLLTNITVPTLVLGAQHDEFSGPVEPLANAINGAQCATVPRTTHHSILTDPAAKDIVFEFLGLPPPVHYEHSW